MVQDPEALKLAVPFADTVYEKPLPKFASESAAGEIARRRIGVRQMVETTNNTSVEKLNQANVGKLPEHLGLVVTEVGDGRIVGRFTVRPDLVAHTGYLLAGVGLTLADLLCAYGVSSAWPEGARSFTTAEVKCNFIGTATNGEVEIIASIVHSGRTTQLWDAEMTSLSSGRRMALFRATQIILYPA